MIKRKQERVIIRNIQPTKISNNTNKSLNEKIIESYNNIARNYNKNIPIQNVIIKKVQSSNSGSSSPIQRVTFPSDKKNFAQVHANRRGINNDFLLQIQQKNKNSNLVTAVDYKVKVKQGKVIDLQKRNSINLTRQQLLDRINRREIMTRKIEKELATKRKQEQNKISNKIKRIVRR